MATPINQAQIAAQITERGPEWERVIAERRERRREQDRARKAAARSQQEQRDRERLADTRRRQTPQRREQERLRDARRRQTRQRREQEQLRQQNSQRKRPPRPFLAVDGEGAGRDEIGRQPYVLMKAAGHGLDFTLHRDGRGLLVRECLEFLLSLPRGPILVGFSIGYDATQILRGITKPPLTLKRILNPRQGNHGPLSVYWGEFAITYQQGQYFRVARIDRSGPKPKVLKGSSRTVYDVFAFFQTSFLSAITTWNIGTDEERAIIAAIKDQRNEFSGLISEMVEYCALECRLLAQVTEKLRDACTGAGIRPRRWSGSGWIARFLLEHHGIPKRPLTPRERERAAAEMATKGVAEAATEAEGSRSKRRRSARTIPRRPERDFEFEIAANAAYYGGRSEVPCYGHIPGPIYQYDQHSAFPAAMLDLPCPLHTEWEHRPALRRLPKDEIYIAKVMFTHPQANRWGGLPFRRKGSGVIFFPLTGTGWYWSIEIEAAREHIRTSIAAVHDVWVAHCRCDCPPPYAWVREVYDDRRALDAANPGAGIPLKLGLTALYGKAAQRVGKGPWHDPVTAGLTTAITRARLLEAIAQDPEAVVMVATDSIFSTRPLALDIGGGLGQWEAIDWPDLFIVQPGVYWSPSALEASIKSRGAPRSIIGKAAPRFVQAFDDWLPKMRQPDTRSLMLDRREMLPRVSVTMRVFYGCRWALFAKRQPSLAGRWGNETQAIGFDWRTKRDARQIIVGEQNILTFPHPGRAFEESYGYWPADFDRKEDVGNEDEDEATVIDDNMLFEAMPDRVEWLPHEK